MKAPKLTCVISGQSRYTSEKYLKEKADRLGKSVQWLLENYVSKNVCSELRKGVHISKLTDSDICDSRLETLVRHNSKCREDFTFENGYYKAAVTSSKAPKAPKVVVEKKESKKVEQTLEEVIEESSNTDQGFTWINKEEVEPLETADEAFENMITENNPF